MFKRCFLHIGTEKTGTTSIQNFLAANREALERGGFFYPSSFGLPNQVGLAAYTGEPERVADLLRGFGYGSSAEDAARFRRTLEERFRQEVSDRESADEVLLLSSEHLHSRARRSDGIARLRDFLAGFCREITVVVYLRRQDQLAVSLSSTHYKTGKSNRFELPRIGRALPYYYDYQAILENYAAIFGQSQCVVRLFERGTLRGGDVIADYSLVTGLPSSLALRILPEQNQSLTTLGQRLLAELNKHFPPDEEGRPSPLRANLADIITTHYPGRPEILSRAEAQRFYAHFRDGNQMVKARFFPDLPRPTLFAEDFGSYPETVAEPALDFEQGCAAAACLWRVQALRIQQLRKQIWLARRELTSAMASVSDAGGTRAVSSALALLEGAEEGAPGKRYGLKPRTRAPTLRQAARN